MIQRFLNRFRSRPDSPGAPALPPTSWELHKDYVRIDPSVIVDPIASVKLFNPPDPPRICLEIGEGSHIFANFSLLRPQAKIGIGRRCQIGASLFVAADSIEVGDDVLMAWGITIMDSNNHSLFWEERRFDVERCRRDYLATDGWDLARSHDWSKVETKAVRIGNKTWIGFNVIVLKGVTIGEGAVIASGSVVTSDVKPWHIGGGNPFRHIRSISRNRDDRHEQKG
jgi:galactoside O-acetyltransferase